MTYFLAVLGGIIYRLRGGPLKDWYPEIFGTQLSRIVWAVPTGALAAFIVGGGLLMYPIMILSVFLGLAVIGHGAHMITSAENWRSSRTPSVPQNDTELVTFWLPAAFGSEISVSWSDSRIEMYHMVGMSACGVARHIISFLPLAIFGHPIAYALMIALGLLHGPAYLLGNKIDDSRIAEILIGALTWLGIIAVQEL